MKIRILCNALLFVSVYGLAQPSYQGACAGTHNASQDDTGSTGNAVATDPAAREQVHIQMMEAPPGRRSAAGLKDTILGKDGVVIDPTPVLAGMGYQKR